MGRIFITGSSTGLGLMAGQYLAKQGHRVVLHARNHSRATDALNALPEAETALVGDVESIQGTADLAETVNALGSFDAVIHNAGVGYDGGRRLTSEGLPIIVAVNALAPYILTSRIARPKRLIYLSSSMHLGINANLEDLLWQQRGWDPTTAYSESKLHILLLAFAIAGRWDGVLSNGVDPGWVPTRMGGPGAPDDLAKGCETQSVLAAPSPDSPLAHANGKYFHHLRESSPNPLANDTVLQKRFVSRCAEITGIELPL